MTTKKQKNEVATTTPNLPVTADTFAQYKEFSANKVLDVERVMPVLQLIQQNSKALIKSHEKYLAGAEAGMFVNRASNYMAAQAIFVPCARKHVYVEWIPMNKGGGKVGEFPIDDKRITALRQAQGFGKITTPEGNEILETFYVFGYVLRENDEDPIPEPAVLAVKGTSITPYRQFFNQLRSYLVRDENGQLIRDAKGEAINPPLFAHQLRLSAQPRSKDGNDFMVMKFEHRNGTIENSMIGGAALAFGAAIANDVNQGRAKVEEEQDAGTGAPSETSAF